MAAKRNGRNSPSYRKMMARINSSPLFKPKAHSLIAKPLYVVLYRYSTATDEPWQFREASVEGKVHGYAKRKDALHVARRHSRYYGKGTACVRRFYCEAI